MLEAPRTETLIPESSAAGFPANSKLGNWLVCKQFLYHAFELLYIVLVR